MIDINTGEIKRLLQQAEEAVSEVKDESLRKSAFEAILIKGLGTGASPSGSLKPDKKVKRRSLKIRGSATSEKAPLSETDLKLTQEQLLELKSFYESRKPSGEEEMVFCLAEFCSNNLKKEKFNLADIIYLYKKVLAVRPTVKPIPTTDAKIKRALGWLVAPSRKKMWLEYDSNIGTYEISAVGKLKTYDEPTVSGNNQ